MHNIIQVAGIIDAAEADLIIAEGADWLGFPLRLPSGRDDIAERDAAAIIASLPADRAGVLISYMTRADDVAAFCEQLDVRGVQLHGDIALAEVRRLRMLRPDLIILKSLVVTASNRAALRAQVEIFAPHVDMFITDTFDPRTGARGATGLTHDWDISAELVALSPRPLMLAGGLSPDNVAAAIAHVRPAAVDAHTLLEGADRRKSRDKLRRFVAEARRAFAALDTHVAGPAAAVSAPVVA